MSYLVDFVENQIKWHYQSDVVNRLLCYLHQDVIPRTGNNFDELVEIARVAKPWNALAYEYKPFVEKLKAKIIEQRGEESSQELIRKFI